MLTMSIATYIQKEILPPRLRQTGVLVVSDPARCYRELCAGLAAEDLRVEVGPRHPLRVLAPKRTSGPGT